LKDVIKGIPISNKDSQEEARNSLKIVGHPLTQEATTSNVIASPSVSRTLGESDTASNSSLAKEVGSDPTRKGESIVKAPWIDLFENRNPSKGISLQFMDNLPEVPKLKQEHVLDVYLVWGFSLVGYITGQFLGKSALLKLCDSWNIKYKYFAYSSDWLIFKFENESFRDNVLAGGPHTIFGRPLMLKVMPSFFEFDDQNINFMPIWVNLPDLPIECWT